MPNLALCCSSVDNLTSICCARRKGFALEGMSRRFLASSCWRAAADVQTDILSNHAGSITSVCIQPFVLQYSLQHQREAKIVEKWKREGNTYHQSFYAGKQKCFSMSDSFHQQDSLNLVCSADQIYPPFLGYSMCFPEDTHADVHLRIKE